MRFATSILAALILSEGAIAAAHLPRPDRDQIQAMVDKIGAMQQQVNGVMAKADGNALENDSRARRYLLDYSQKLERLINTLNDADANWDNDSAYGQSVRSSCLETRRLFVSNSQAERAAGELPVGGIRRDNPVFSDSRIDVNDTRTTIFCDVYERDLDNHNHWTRSKWNSTYNVNGQDIFATIEFNGTHGSYKADGVNGRFSEVIYFEDHISARWQAGREGGWLELPLKASAFNGHWGRGQLGGSIGGEWRGNAN